MKELAALALLAAPLLADENRGDTRHVEFLPFAEALARAQDEGRLLFLKPVYGGVDDAGAADYRCGTW